MEFKDPKIPPKLQYDMERGQWIMTDESDPVADTCDAYVLDEHGNLVYKELTKEDEDKSNY